MIAGEMEHLLSLNSNDTAYDELFGFGKKNKKKNSKQKAATKAARKEKRKNFLKKLESKVKDSGGIEGIANSASNVLNLFKGSGGSTTMPSDYQIGLQDPRDDDKKTPVVIYVVGGVLGLALIGFAIKKIKNSSPQNS